MQGTMAESEAHSHSEEFKWLRALKCSLSYIDDSDDSVLEIPEDDRIVIDEIVSKTTIRDAQRLRLILVDVFASLEALAHTRCSESDEDSEEEKKDNSEPPMASSDSIATASLLLKIKDIVHGR
eukprot:14430231-Ditylum_brightwellii.AAC.1